MKKAILLLIPLFVASLVLAKGPGPGPQPPPPPPQKPVPPPPPPPPLPAPLTITATQDGDDIDCTWDAVEGADKYALEVCLAGTVTYTDATGAEVTAPVKVNISAGSTTPSATIAALDEIAKVLGVTADAISAVDTKGVARVKALDPGKGAGPQCNPFAVTDVTFVITPPPPDPQPEP